MRPQKKTTMIRGGTITIALVLAALLILQANEESPRITPSMRPVPYPRVIAVLDGDTIKVEFPDGVIEIIRIIGLDAPEVPHPGKRGECFGQEATEKIRALVLDKEILLETNPPEDRDKYGRLLRYLIVENADIGALMIREGYARNYPWFPHPRLDRYSAWEAEAKEHRRGLWGRCR